MDLSLTELALLFATSVLAGAINAIAGGGSFFTFPVLLLAGIPSVEANATNKLGLWIGAVGSVKGYLPEIRTMQTQIWPVLIINVVGGICGSALLLTLSNAQFSAAVPWLLLLAFLMFAFGPRIRKWCGLHAESEAISRGLISYAGQFLMALYSGFFGAGIGIFLLALYQWMGMKNLHQMNAIKVLATASAHTVSALVFVVMGTVVWQASIVMLTGAFAGGYISARLAKRLPSEWIQRFVLVYSAAITIYFFVK